MIGPTTRGSHRLSHRRSHLQWYRHHFLCLHHHQPEPPNVWSLLVWGVLGGVTEVFRLARNVVNRLTATQAADSFQNHNSSNRSAICTSSVSLAGPLMMSVEPLVPYVPFVHRVARSSLGLTSRVTTTGLRRVSIVLILVCLVWVMRVYQAQAGFRDCESQ